MGRRLVIKNSNSLYTIYFTILSISDLVNRDISTAKGSRKPMRLDCL
jgi:hypothetical protein